MYRHMGRVGHQAALAIEYGAGEIETLLDVDGVGGVGQYTPHLFGDGHIEIIEDLQRDGIRLRANGIVPGSGFDPLKHQVPSGGYPGSPARFHHGG